MALCRCSKLHGYPKGITVSYVIMKEPIGYPLTSSICGIKGCRNPGLIWLTKEELIDYEKGQRIFAYQSAVSKVILK